MADYYVRGTTGNDNHAGTSEGTAKKTHYGVALLSPSGGSTIYHTQEQEGSGVGLSTFTSSNLRFVNEPGVTGISPAIVRGWRFPAAASWLPTGTRSYVSSIGTTHTVAAVFDRYLQRIDASGRRACFLRPVENIAAVDSATNANTWFYSKNSGILYVQLDGTDPDTLSGNNRVGWVASNAGGIVAEGGNSLIEDLRFEFVRPSGASPAYQIQTNNGGNVIRRCAGWDASVHHLVCLGSVNDTIEDCVFHGGGQLPSGSESNTPIACYSDSTNVTGLRIRRCEVHCYSYLNPSGSPVNSGSTNGITAIKIHTDGLGGRVVNDVQVEDTWSYHYGQPGELIDVSNCAPAPSNILDFSAFPVRVLRSGARNMRQMVLNSNMAFKNCFFDFTRASATTDTYQCWLFSSGATVSFFGCTFIFDQGSQAGRSMFRLENGAKLSLVECTVINRSVNPTGPHTFFLMATTGFTLKAHRSIFFNAYTGGTITRFIGGDSGAPSGQYDMVGNIYYGIDSTKFSNDTSRDSQTEWLANIDRSGSVFDPLFINVNSTDPSICGALAGGSPLLNDTRKTFVPGYVDYGINGRKNDGTIGSWKYGKVITGEVVVQGVYPGINGGFRG